MPKIDSMEKKWIRRCKNGFGLAKMERIGLNDGIYICIPLQNWKEPLKNGIGVAKMDLRSSLNPAPCNYHEYSAQLIRNHISHRLTRAVQLGQKRHISAFTE